ncbi:hypothetical protein L6452_42385 [Arctium lappa]|uniref:Uncharacterized protein n=1 Tax=Arctium lappa TaxID=4217 RepID=A0ACB8XIC3_ARCLA|nr:hypothetical protein L6452_42385 [Arctium lappa]
MSFSCQSQRKAKSRSPFSSPSLPPIHMQKVINSSICNTKAKHTSYHATKTFATKSIIILSQENHRQSHLHQNPFHSSSTQSNDLNKGLS